MNILKTVCGVGALILALLPTANGAETSTNAPASIDKKVPTVEVRFLDDKGNVGPKTTTPKVIKTAAEWSKQLTAEQYTIARGKGTERPFCGDFYDHKQPGVYACLCCGLPLFTSDTKYHSGTGWPSFIAPVAKENVKISTDKSHGMIRTEVLCTRCDAHLGHVFDDGPPPTGQRYCMNSASLVFKKDAKFKDGTATIGK